MVVYYFFLCTSKDYKYINALKSARTFRFETYIIFKTTIMVDIVTDSETDLLNYERQTYLVASTLCFLFVFVVFVFQKLDDYKEKKAEAELIRRSSTISKKN